MRGFLAFLAVALVALVVAGFWFGWWSVSTDHGEGLVSATLAIHTDRIGNVTHELGEKARHASESVKSETKDSAGGTTVDGTIRGVDSTDRKLTVASKDGSEIVLYMDQSSRVVGAGTQGPQTGDSVSARYQQENGKNIARTITVKSN